MKRKDLLFLLISITFIVALWVAFSILHTTLTSTLTSQTVANSQPIQSTFDTKTLSALKKRLVVSPENSLEISLTPTPTPIPPPAANSLQTVQLATGSAAASQGGTTK